MSGGKSDCVYGFHAVSLLSQRAPERIIRVAFDKKAMAKWKTLIQDLEQRHIAIEPADNKQLEKWAQDRHHQGIIAWVKPAPMMSQSELIHSLEQKQKPLVVLLDEVQDPHNVGAILRTACAFGVDAVIAPSHKACALTPGAKKAACGGDLVVPYVQVSNLSQCMEALKQIGFWLVGTCFDEQSKPVAQIDFNDATGLVMGSEGKGLRPKTKAYCDFFAYIPMLPEMESLNVSVACGISLYEATRQRGL